MTAVRIDAIMVAERLADYRANRPDQRNPIGTKRASALASIATVPTCRYTDVDDPTWHCGVGQVIFDLTGHSIPADVVESFDVLLDDGYFDGICEITDAAHTLLSEFQTVCDNAGLPSTWKPRPWRFAVDLLADIGTIESLVAEERAHTQ